MTKNKVHPLPPTRKEDMDHSTPPPANHSPWTDKPRENITFNRTTYVVGNNDECQIIPCIICGLFVFNADVGISY